MTAKHYAQDYDGPDYDDPLDDGLVYTCDGCGEICQRKVIDDSFSYSGTHCTNGLSGVYSASLWIGSECCEDAVTEFIEDEC